MDAPDISDELAAAKFACSVCCLSFSTNRNLKSHNAVYHIKTEEKGSEDLPSKKKAKFSCTKCEITLPNKTSFARHNLKQHPKVKKAAKKPQPKIKNKKLSGKSKKLSEKGKKVSVKSKKLAAKIEELPEDEAPTEKLACPICEITFCSKNSLKRHNLKQHPPVEECPVQEPEIDLPDMEGPPRSAKFFCPKCEITFSTNSSFKRHNLKQHPNAEEEEEEEEEEEPPPVARKSKPSVIYSCPMCEITFASKSNLKRHDLKYHGITDFDYEEAPTVEEKELDTADGGTTKFSCSRCDVTFSTRGNLKRHYVNHHVSSDETAEDATVEETTANTKTPPVDPKEKLIAEIKAGTTSEFVSKIMDRATSMVRKQLIGKLSDLSRRHDLSEVLLPETVYVTSEKSWSVRPSASNLEMYHVKLVTESCECNIRCERCGYCIHQFTCSCPDNRIIYNMCKHIHLVCRIIGGPKPRQASPTYKNQLRWKVQSLFAEIDRCATDQDLRVIDRHVSAIGPNLEALREHRNTASLPSLDSNTSGRAPANKNADQQRHLYSPNKKPRLQSSDPLLAAIQTIL